MATPVAPTDQFPDLSEISERPATLADALALMADESLDAGGEEVGVAVHGHRDGRVPEVDLDGFGVGAGGDQRIGIGPGQRKDEPVLD